MKRIEVNIVIASRVWLLAPCQGNEIVKNWDNQSCLLTKSYEAFFVIDVMIRYISLGTFFESCDRVCETTAPVPCVSGIGTGHSNASPGQEPPLPLT